MNLVIKNSFSLYKKLDKMAALIAERKILNTVSIEEDIEPPSQKEETW